MGGLVVKKPREEFKKPSGARESVLGLDVLASAASHSYYSYTITLS